MKTPNRRTALMFAAGAAAGSGLQALGSSTRAQTSSASALLFSVPQAFVPIAGLGQHFPVRRVYCIGRNYAAHAREMGSDPTREPPFFFQKPADAVQVVP